MAKDINSGPWMEGIWKDWAEERGTSLPRISHLEPRRGPHLVFHKDKILKLEDSFELPLDEHYQKYGDLPLWITPYKDRPTPNILTKYRTKRLTAHLVNRRNKEVAYLERIHNTFYRGGYIFNIYDPINAHLLHHDIWVIEPELVKSKSKRLLVYRFLTLDDTLRLAAINWIDGSDNKTVRFEEKDKTNKWRVIERASISLDVESPELEYMVFSRPFAGVAQY